jgi:cytochrome c peroxidase
MKKKYLIILLFAVAGILSYSFKDSSSKDFYTSNYYNGIRELQASEQQLLAIIEQSDVSKEQDKEKIKAAIDSTRVKMKKVDFWMRYLDPLVYKKINSPLPVEWETEVFEKFEKPYKREGAGLTLAALYMDEEDISKEKLRDLIKQSVEATSAYMQADSITKHLNAYHHFYLCNRLYLLNLAAIYTTGFECPNTDRVIPELRGMMADVNNTYKAFNESFTETPITPEYINLYQEAIRFVNTQPEDYTQFDHYTFIRDYINPLFTINQQLIKNYKVVSKSNIDFSLNKTATSIFSKDLYDGQNAKGIFLRVRDEEGLAEIDRVGKMLFYDPILSSNNLRSCASCHKPTEFFTDTLAATAFQFNHEDRLPRNSPSLINAEFNHLVMLDGKHYTLQHQTKGVMMNPIEMGMKENEIVKKVMSCNEYKKAFNKLLKYTPQEPEVTIEHISSVITAYYSKFSKYYAPFDEAMNKRHELEASAQRGFNLFMSKAQCATCHFVPQFNGVKPPYIGSEFEVLGVPADTTYTRISSDRGRYEVNPATETMNAFRTGTVRNAAHTMPYMHNGVFTTMEQVIDFYDRGGGAGRGLKVENQTLSSDSLKLTRQEKNDLISFINSLNENIEFEASPVKLPTSKMRALNKRKVGGEY